MAPIFVSRRETETEMSDEVYSKRVRAGKRTYYFDIRDNSHDYYLTITERRKKVLRDGTAYHEKQKIYLYKEDFEKFEDGFRDAIQFIRLHKPEWFSDPTVPIPAMVMDEEIG